MKKEMKLILSMLLMLLLLCVPQMAKAEKVVEYSEHLYCSPGQERAAVYPDFSSKIGAGLTKNDFVITYESASEYLTVDENGLCAVSADAPLMYNLRLRITYTPKTAGVGEKTTFVVVLRTIEPMTEFEADRDIIYTYVNGGQTQLDITGVSDHEKQIVDISYDPAIISLDTYTFYDKILHYYVKPAGKAGVTDIVFTSYNNMTTRTKVIVVDRPSKLEFASDRFVCHVGDTVDLGTDTGNGEYGLIGYTPSVTLYSGNTKISAEGFFTDGGRYFNAKETGFYRIEMKADAYSDSTVVEVYDKANCKLIELSSGDLYKDRAGITVDCYDENGNPVYLPMSITAGADIASLEGNVISVTGLGKVTITVQNNDGTTTSRTYDVVQNPTKLTLNATEVTIPIEGTFNLKVGFDQGSYPYEYSIEYENTDPPYGLHCIRMEGDRVIAQAPGSATITVTAGPLKGTCKVTVPKSEKELSVMTPPDPFGIGHTFKLEVKDQTGKVYPATFVTHDGSPEGVLVKPDGTITGNSARTGWVTATLEDGRVLKVGIDVKQVPNWLEYRNIAIRLSDGMAYLDQLDSDVGKISLYDVDVTVEDTSIATYPGRGIYRLDLHKAGTTKVTFKSIYSDASVTIILEVIGRDMLYAGSTSIELPYGYMTSMPPVMDGNGKLIEIAWAITYELPGEGNPEASGFVLEDDTIACVWPTASCVVTGTAPDGATVKVFINGYLMPTEIRTEPTGLKMAVGETRNIKVVTDQAGAAVKLVYWVAETEGIVNYAEVTEGDTLAVRADAAGSTRMLAVLDNGAYAICDILVYDRGSYTPGDVNEDGQVNQDDALLVMQYDAGWPVSINVYAADADGDGRVEAEDALLILQRSAGMDVVLRKHNPVN